MKNIVKKVSSITMFVFTIGCLYVMSKGLVGIAAAYILLAFHICRLLAEITAARLIADKLTIREDIRTEIPRKSAHMLVCLITGPMIYFSFKETFHIIITLTVSLGIIYVLDKTGFVQKNATRNGTGSDNTMSIYYLFIAFTINNFISLFIPQYAIGALLGIVTLGLGDPSACVVGKLFGKHKFKNGKSVEGFIAFIIGATISMFMFTHIAIWKLIPIALVGAIAEAYSGEKDNMMIQLTVALAAFIIL